MRRFFRRQRDNIVTCLHPEHYQHFEFPPFTVKRVRRDHHKRPEINTSMNSPDSRKISVFHHCPTYETSATTRSWKSPSATAVQSYTLQHLVPAESTQLRSCSRLNPSRAGNCGINHFPYFPHLCGTRLPWDDHGLQIRLRGRRQ